MSVEAELLAELEALTAQDTITDDDLRDFMKGLPTDPQLARLVELALPWPFDELFEHVEDDPPYWRGKPSRDHPNQVAAQRAFAAASADARGTTGTVERDGRELPASAAHVAEQLEGTTVVASPESEVSDLADRLRELLGQA